MPRRTFDIIPPTIKKITQPLKPQKEQKYSSLNSLLFTLIVSLVLAIIFWSYLSYGENSTQNIKDSEILTSKFELFNPEGESSFTNSKNEEIKLKVVYNLENFNLADEIGERLKNKNWQISFEQADQLYSEKIIYYNNGNKSLAEELQNHLKDLFETKIEPKKIENFDILIILGGEQ